MPSAFSVQFRSVTMCYQTSACFFFFFPEISFSRLLLPLSEKEKKKKLKKIQEPILIFALKH